MHRYLACLLLCTCPALGTADVYKWIDAQGRTVYSDHPPDTRAQRLNLAAPLPAPQASAKPDQPATAAAPAPAKEEPRTAEYKAVQIAFPQNDATVRDNAGDVAVQITTTPALDSDVGDRIVVFLDGVRRAMATSPVVTLQDVDRGTHTLQVTVEDNRGQTLATSPSTVFHLQRTSVLHHP